MNSYQKRDGSLECLDVGLQLFYKRVLEKELDLDDPRTAKRIKRAMKQVVAAYKKSTVESLSSSILFDSAEKRCAYVLKHCACFTSAVARHFQQFLLSNPTVLDKVLERQQLNLCCVGGGPATDAVAVAKVIRSMVFADEGERTLSIKVSVVDLSGDWQSTAERVVQSLAEEPEFLRHRRVSMQFELLQADLTEECPATVTATLAAADVVTMVYFVSAVNGSRRAGQCRPMLERIMRTSKPGVALFFLDSSKEVHYDSFRSAAHSVGCLERVYGPRTNDFHTLSASSIDLFVKLYSRFDVFMCLTNCFVTCAAWLKRSGATTCDQPTPETDSDSLSERFDRNTARQRRFRQKLEMRHGSGSYDHDQDSDGVAYDDDDDLYGGETFVRVEHFLRQRYERRKKLLWSCRFPPSDEPSARFRRGTGLVADDGRDVHSEKVSRRTKWVRKKGVEEGFGRE